MDGWNRVVCYVIYKEVSEKDERQRITFYAREDN